MIDGYYWARYRDNGMAPSCDQTTFIVLLEDGQWFTVGINGPVDFDPADIICKVQRSDH